MPSVPSVELFHSRGRMLARVCTLFALVAAVVAVVAVGTPDRVLAFRACDVRTLRGSYLFAASGFNIVGGVAQPKAIVEAIDFNGDGTLEVPAATVSINGNVISSTAGAGAYTLDESCRGTLAFSSGPSFNIFTDRKGAKVWMIQTNPGTVMEGTAARIVRRGGTAED
jgi:hypothetical protein